MNRPPFANASAALLPFAAILLASCAREERVVYYKPFFSGLEGVQTQSPPVYDKGPAIPLAKESAPAAGGDEPLAITGPDGKKKLISRSGVQLMHHIQATLAAGDAQLFADQVLSEATRREYRERARDPAEALKALKESEKDIAKLFARMPMGEHSPNVLMEPLGGNVFRVKLTGPAVRDLRWTGFDMVLEKGNWKLRWFV